MSQVCGWVRGNGWAMRGVGESDEWVGQMVVEEVLLLNEVRQWQDSIP